MLMLLIEFGNCYLDLLRKIRDKRSAVNSYAFEHMLCGETDQPPYVVVEMFSLHVQMY